jgi:hypothetical protein
MTQGTTNMLRDIQIMQDGTIYWSEVSLEALSDSVMSLHRRCATPGDDLSAVPEQIRDFAMQHWTTP